MKTRPLTHRSILRNSRRLLAPAAATLALMGTAIGCGSDVEGQRPDPQLQPPTNVEGLSFALNRFEDCDQLSDYLADVIVEELISSRYGEGGWLAGEDDTAEAAPGNDGGGDAPDDYTGTNNQEEGVDEADLVKTDGTHIYVANGSHLSIVKSWPAEETERIAQVEVGGNAHNLFLRGDRALVFSYIYGQEDNVFEGFELRGWSGTRMTIVNIADRANPVIERHIDMEGYFANGRMIEGDVYMVLNTYFNLPQEAWELVWSRDGNSDLPEMDWQASELEKELIRARARSILRPRVEAMMARTDVSQWLPLMRQAQPATITEATPERMYACNDIYRPNELTQRGVLSIVHVDLDNGEAPVRSTGLLANGWQIYASQENLYVALSSNWWWWGWGSTDVETHIHKFNLSNHTTGPRYVASGKVPGWTLNQFSMSEHEGHLRVATTESVWWNDGQGGNNLFVMEDRQGELTTVGSVEGIEPDEQIFAMRMMGDKGYMVTFRQTDPLFTFDLSDPRNPRLLGELHMPGFSSYLHPLGDDHLLAVGREGDEEGRVWGIAIQIFDVSDPRNPLLAHKHVIETGDWSWSEALWNHHAFTFHRGVLSIPAYVYNYDEDNRGGSYFSGLMVFDIDAEGGISQRGGIDHSDLASRQACPYIGRDREYCQDFYEYNWYAQMRRSVYIEDYLYSLSGIGLKVSMLDDPDAELANVMLVPER